MKQYGYRKRIRGPVVALSIFVGIIVFVNIWGIVIDKLTGGEKVGPRSGNLIDVIYVQGTIADGETTYNHVWTVNLVDSLIYDEYNKGIFLYVNSPGGGIYEADELYLKLKEYKEVTGRPVYAYMAQQAASGGLYICMAADKIYANRMTLTGSIGVIMSLTDTTGLQELIGIKEEHITSGANKAMGNPLTEEQRDILQEMINESYDIFVNIIAENREGLSVEKVKELADGRVYSAKQAKDLGLIDEIGTFDEAVDAFINDNGLQGCNLYAEEMPRVGLLDVLLNGETNIDQASALSHFTQIKNYIDDNKFPKLMYLME